jgi:hypothetical protein
MIITFQPAAAGEPEAVREHRNTGPGDQHQP